MAVITLTTDWKNSDYYIGALKGKIISNDPSTIIVDISHQIEAFNVMQAAFVLRSCFEEFPKGTVHLIGVNTTLSKDKPLLILEQAGHYFICSDSGFPGLLFPETKFDAYRVPLDINKGKSFASLDAYLEIAFELLKGKAPSELAKPSSEFVKNIPLLPTIDKQLINGSVVYIDSYSNAITNISKQLFDRVGEGLDFEIFIQSNHYKIDKISHSYLDEPSGELLAIFNSQGMLEVAMNHGPASELLNLTVNSTIRVKFFSNEDKELKLFGN